jgi:CoA:oxalate CoA-transferase
MEMRPLEGLLVVDLSQFLAGPAATLRFADLGARVVKIEHPRRGDLCRGLYVTNVVIDGDSTLFHAINRDKESFAADLKDDRDLEAVLQLIDRADIVVQNFRPGVARRLGVDYEQVRERNERLVYGRISGYGTEGPWAGSPGQDLLAQARSGVMWLNGDRGAPPVPVGLAVADMLAGAHLAQGILACLVRRGTTGRGGLVEASLLESLIDFQFEVLTTYLSSDHRQEPDRGPQELAHPYLSAPYGVYATADGYIAIAMGSVPRLGQLLGLPALEELHDETAWFTHRDEVIRAISALLSQKPTAHWLSALEPAGVWCAEVLDWPQLLEHEAFQALDMLQAVGDAPRRVVTTRCPVLIDGEILAAERPAPRIDEHGPDLPHRRSASDA